MAGLKPDGAPVPNDLPSPKRGAFPTPKADLEKAPKYIPETNQPSEKAGAKPSKQRD